MIKAFGNYWKNYFNFKGRTRRKDFWLAILALFVVEAIISVIVSKGATGVDATTGLPTYAPWATALSGIWGLATLIPSLSLFTRRMHDVDKRFWYCLMGLIPVVGIILVFVKELTAGTVGDNRFGADPKAETAIAEQ